MRFAGNFLIAVCSLTALLASLPAAGQAKNILGIELGSRFLLSECGTGGGAVTTRACVSPNPVVRKPWGADEYHVALPISGTPSYVRGEIKVALVQGIVESVQIGTWGIQSQNGVLTALTNQYGKPTRIQERKQPLSRTPAQFAEWELADFSVKLNGSTGSIDWGSIEVSTRRYLKLVSEYEARPGR